MIFVLIYLISAITAWILFRYNQIHEGTLHEEYYCNTVDDLVGILFIIFIPIGNSLMAIVFSYFLLLDKIKSENKAKKIINKLFLIK